MKIDSTNRKEGQSIRLTAHARKRIGERIGALSEGIDLFKKAKKIRFNGINYSWKNGKYIFITKYEGLKHVIITVKNIHEK